MPIVSRDNRYDVLVMGSLIGFDLLFAEHLARRGLDVRVARHVRDEHSGVAAPSEYFRALAPDALRVYRRPEEVVLLARRARLVATFSGTFGFALGFRWRLRRLLGIPPVFNFATGSDFAETLSRDGARGNFYRHFVATCAYNAVHVYPHIIKNVFRHRVANVAFLRHPYFLPPVSERRPRVPGPVRYFHPSHLDWGVNDSGSHRTSTKGNDRFLRALLRAMDDGLDAECLILDRGPDRELARELIAGSRQAGRFTWRPQLSRSELAAEFARADVVVDQFDVGGLGGIALEAMALERPVMTYLHGACLDLLYARRPPVLNVRTEDEIFSEIRRHSDLERLAAIGREAGAWVREYYTWEKTVDQFLFYFTLLGGRPVVDYGFGHFEAAAISGD